MAAPAVPISNTATRRRSPRMLRIHAIATVRRGIFESPSPLKILPTRLYATMKMVPTLQMRMYETVSSKASFGA